MKFRPLRDNVLIKRVDAAEKTASGLYIPDSAKEKPQQAQVMAVGPGRKNKDGDNIAMTVQVGDIVLFGKYSGNELSLDGEDYLILRESDILAVVHQ